MLSGIMASSFNGSTYIRNDATIQGFLSSGSDLFIAYCYNSSVNTGPFNQQVFDQAPTSGNPQVIQVIHQSISTRKNSTYLYVAVTGGNTTTGLLAKSNPGSLPTNGSWHQLLIQINTSAGTITAYLDNAPLALTITERLGTPFSIPYYNLSNGIALPIAVGGLVGGGNYYNGSLAELYLIAGTPIDTTNANVRNAFIDPISGLVWRAGDHPAVVDTSGGGINVLQTFYPQIHLWGGPNQFLLNQPNWTDPPWNWNSPPTSRIDNGPNKFYVAAGALTTASSDPWGFTGET